MYLHTIENYTQYLNDLIDRDRLDRLDHKVIDNKIEKCRKEIKELQDLKKTKPINENKIHECLQFWHDAFETQTFRDDAAFIKVIEKRVLPNVKKFGYKGSSQDLCTLLLNWPED